MQFENITESDFLLTELWYTIGQVRAQILDMEDGRLVSGAMHGSLKSILEDMTREEPSFQHRCSQLVRTNRRGETNRQLAAPFAPFEGSTSVQQSFEAGREQTIAVLQAANREWSDELKNLVRQQLEIDRKHTTAIAESWRVDHTAFPAGEQVDPSLPFS